MAISGDSFSPFRSRAFLLSLIASHDNSTRVEQGSWKKQCPCGRPLHYTLPFVGWLVEGQIADEGPEQVVEVIGHRWLVPRHYIALHGLKAEQLPDIAERYGFKEAT